MSYPGSQVPAASWIGNTPPDTGQDVGHETQAETTVPPYQPYQPYPGNQPYGYGQMSPPSAPLMPGQSAPPSQPLAQGQQVPPLYPPPYAPPSQGFAAYRQGYPPYQQAPTQPPRKRRVWLVAGIVAATIVLCVAVAAVGTLAVAALVPSGRLTPHLPPNNLTSGAASTATALAGSSGGTVIFDDDFSSSGSGWSNDSHCTYGNDGYHIPDGYVCYAPVEKIGDSVITANVEQVAGDTDYYYGVVFRRVSTGNYYEFEIDGQSDWSFSKRVDTKRTELIPDENNVAIHSGLNAVNSLTVRAKGTHFTFFVNGVQVGQYDDATYSSGRCGIVGDSGGGVQVVVKHFTVSQVS